ncbi:hypothetical protein F5883DRAFT_640546 [Diaporthe sp. PMI_573]|nr:hypothetical protein F5883DRAFT_640546 [Diaporthaceae sp. PMI_573]
MTDPQQLLAKVPRRAGRMSLPLNEDASTVVDSELTADASPTRYAHSHDAVDGSINTPYEGYARIFGFDVDHTNTDNLKFPGFRPMRYLLTREAARYLLSERQWSNQDDSDDTVGQKNTIVIFVCFATIEECFVDEKSEKLLPVIGPFKALVDTLGMRYQPNGRPRGYEFLLAIRNAVVNSRCDEIKRHLASGNGSPPEPRDLSGLDRMLLDVMDRHIAFLRTKKPLTRLCLPLPLNKLLRLRLIQVKNQLRNKECIEECFKIFVPTISAHQQTPWLRSGRPTAWEAAQAKRNATQPNAAIDSSPSEHRDHGLKPKPAASWDDENISQEDSGPAIPEISMDEFVGSSQSAPAPPSGQPDALSGLQLFKTAAFQVHKTIGSSKDSTDLRKFIDQIEEDIKQFHETLQVRPVLRRAESAGRPGSQIDVLLEPECIRSLMLIGLLLINQQWNQQELTHSARQRIVGDILDELRMIKEAADQVDSARD